MNLYILWHDSLVPQTSYVLNSPSFLLFWLYLFSQANNQFIATTRECEHVWTYRMAHTGRQMSRTSLESKVRQVWILLWPKGWRTVNLIKTTLLIFFFPNVVFLQDTITASAARSDKMERKKKLFCHSIMEVHQHNKISHIQHSITLWTKMLSWQHCGSVHLVDYLNMYSWPNEAELMH